MRNRYANTSNQARRQSTKVNKVMMLGSDILRTRKSCRDNLEYPKKEKQVEMNIQTIVHPNNAFGNIATIFDTALVSNRPDSDKVLFSPPIPTNTREYKPKTSNNFTLNR